MKTHKGKSGTKTRRQFRKKTKDVIRPPESIVPVTTLNAPMPAGHYSQGIVHGGLIYVSGQLPIEPGQTGTVSGGIEEQTGRALRNVEAILEAAGSSLERTLKLTVYISDIGLWRRVNAVYARILGDHRPARSVVPTKELHYGSLIEIDAIAAAGGRMGGPVGQRSLGAN